MLSYLNFLAGIALMLLGVRSLQRGAERLLGNQFRRLLQGATRGRFRSLLAGGAVAVLLPSSTAVALLSVEAINAGYLTFQQMLVVMLGANIGFTVTVQLLAFKFYIYNAPFLVLGTALYLFSRRQNVRGAGQMLTGIGFLLLAIQILSAAVAPLKDSADVVEVMAVLARHPVWLVGFAVLLKVLLQSATATIGIALALCAQGVLPVNGAAAVVIGANIGIGVTALVAGFGRVDTRRMALGNLFFKLVGAAVCVPLLPGIVRLVSPLSLAAATHDTQLIANLHTLFNLALAVVFLPLVPVVARLLERFVPAVATEKAGEGPRYLDPAALESPALALGQATQEILHMADHVRAMLRDARQAFQQKDAGFCIAVQDHDDVVDLLNNEIKAYITKLREQALNREESRREVALLTFANDLENIGDVVDKNLMELAKKKIALGVEFSPDGHTELAAFFQRVMENYEIAVSAFASRDRELAGQLLRHNQHMTEWEQELRNRHFHRLHEGLKESFETSAIHLDILSNLRRINEHLSAVAYAILQPKRS